MAEEGHAVQVATRVLRASESGFYAWRTRPPSPVILTDAIRQIHAASNGIYGSRRVHAELVLGPRSGTERCLSRPGFDGGW